MQMNMISVPFGPRMSSGERVRPSVAGSRKSGAFQPKLQIGVLTAMGLSRGVGHGQNPR